jgi:glycosidase
MTRAFRGAWLAALLGGLVAFVASLTVAGCHDVAGDDYAPPGLVEAGADAGTDGATEPESAALDGAPIPCRTTFRFVPAPGKTYFHAAVTGDWNAFDPAGVAMDGPGPDGAYSADVELTPGVHAYKWILDGQFEIDMAATRRKYVGGVDNSAVVVRDCRMPAMVVASSKSERPSSGAGHYQATLAFHPGSGAPDLDPASVRATLRKDGASATGKATAIASGPNGIAVEASGLADGKYTLFVDARDRAGQVAPSMRLVFWIETEAFDWRDAVLYMAMNDRLANGDPSNDVPPPAGVDPRARFQGGDLEGAKQVIATGALDGLGVRAIWFSPFHRNTDSAYAADDGVHQVTGYHGYWPIRAREVDPRLGGEAALHALVAEAHAHGIRVVMDFVVNHVHEEHEYFKAHPEWFRTGCICGTNNCDWTAHRLDCLFASYLPDVDWTNSEASDQFVSDAVWWVDTFDLDGLRVDAVKHVEDAAIVNLAGGLRDEFEASGTKLFMTGETAMGWSDCTDPGCPGNANDYGTISRYIGPTGLDGQFDFVLYHAASYRTFAWDDRGLAHADYWLRASLASYPAGALMTPFIGSHDTARFVTYATYRDSGGAYDHSVAEHKWDDPAGPPIDSATYAHERLALAWLYAIPGVPLLYYGDEYGQWGGADPNNRVMWRDEAALSSDEKTALAYTRKLGHARRELVPLRRGTYRKILAEDEALVFARETAGDVVLVAMARSGGAVHAALPVSLGLAQGTVLHDWLGGPDVTVGAGAIDLTLGARSTAYLSTRAP